MNLFPDINELITTENLLSSTTYPSKQQHLCIYCHREVQEELTFYKKESISTRQCLCDDALEEIEIKSTVINQLEKLDAMKAKMDLDRVGTALFHDGVEKLRKKYRQNE